MAKGMGDKLVLAISSRALFDLSESHKVYLAEGVETYRQYQIEHEEEILEPGDAFPLVKKLLSLNASLGAPGRGGAGVAQQRRHRLARVQFDPALRPGYFPRRLRRRA